MLRDVCVVLEVVVEVFGLGCVLVVVNCPKKVAG
jgi:hypothetical protein